MSEIVDNNLPVGVYVDVQHLFFAARKLFNSKVNYEKLLNFCLPDQRQLFRAVAYLTVKERNGVVEANNQNFIDTLWKFGYETKNSVQHIREVDGRQILGRTDLAVSMTTDVVSDIAMRRIGTAVLCVGDAEFLPLVQFMNRSRINAEIINFQASTHVSLRKHVKTFVPIQPDILFPDQKYIQYLEARGESTKAPGDQTQTQDETTVQTDADEAEAQRLFALAKAAEEESAN